MIVYLICSSLETGIAEANDRAGWIRIAAARFATEDKDDIRIVTRITDLAPIAGPIHLMKAGDYAVMPEGLGVVQTANWTKDRAAFDTFVEAGQGIWVEEAPRPAVPKGNFVQAAEPVEKTDAA